MFRYRILSMDTLEIFYQLKQNKQFLSTVTDVEGKNKGAYEEALENLVDAYLLYSKNHENSMDVVVAECRKAVLENLKFDMNSDKRLADQMKILEGLAKSAELSVLGSEELSKAVTTLSEALEKNKKLEEEVERLSTASSYSEAEIENLIKDAERYANREKKEVSKQKSEKNKAEKYKKLIMDNVEDRLKAKGSDKSEYDKFIEAHLNDILQAEIVTKEKGEYLRAVFPEDHSVDLKFWTNNGKFIFSPNRMNEKRTVTELHDFLKSGESLVFGEDEKPEKKKKALLTLPSFKKKLGVPKSLTEKQEEALEQERAALSVYMLSGQDDKAQQLEDILKRKYDMLSAREKKEKYQEELLKFERKKATYAKAVKENLVKNMSALSSAEFLNFFAPGCGKNKSEEQRRKNFNQLLQCFSSEQRPLPQVAQKAFLNKLEEDTNLWNNISENYYKNIKKRAEDNVYKVIADDLFEGKCKVKDALRENSAELPREVTRLILLRALELKAMSGIKITEMEKMNSLLQDLGHRIRLKEFTVENGESLRSKPLTAMLRCLADGRKLDLTSEKCGFDDRDRKYIRDNYARFKQQLGSDENFQTLIGDVIEGKNTDKPLSLTPYQKRYKTLGLIAALGMPQNAAVENEIYSQLTGQTNNATLGVRRQLAGWTMDDYLFENYSKILLGKDVDISDKKKLEDLKKEYQWDKFKTENRDLSRTLANEFKENSQKPEKLLADLLIEGKMAKATVHHNDPLKYAICSNNPNDFNRQDNLVITMPWNAWENDNHQMEHFTTMEGVEVAAPYQVKDGSAYKRFPQYDLKKGDVICYEKPQVKVGGTFKDFIPENTMFISSSGLVLPSPKMPELSSRLTKGMHFQANRANEGMSGKSY